MHLENVVFDAADPRHLGREWESRAGAEQLTDEPEGYETRVTWEGGPWLDLCFPLVTDEPDRETRLHVEVAGGTLATLRLESDDPERDAAFWRWLTGWQQETPTSLRHPSGRGPALALVPQAGPKGDAKNPVHLDVRLDPGDDADAVAAGIAERGGREVSPGWGDLPWRVFTDPSGNELCVLTVSHDEGGT